MIDAAARRTIEAIVSVFETGNPLGDYSAVVVLADGAGISYGLHQLTDGGGNLVRCLEDYIEADGRHAKRLAADLEWLRAHGSTKEDPANLSPRCRSLMAALDAAGDDPIMVDSQDRIFDLHYWRPAADQAEAMGLELPLSWAVVYDSTIHSGPGGVAGIRALFPERPPRVVARGGSVSKGGDEQAWTLAYCRARYVWLAGNRRERVRITAARPRAFLALAASDNWSLRTPLRVLGVEVRTTSPAVS